jgi:hypothetical protein
MLPAADLSEILANLSALNLKPTTTAQGDFARSSFCNHLGRPSPF